VPLSFPSQGSFLSVASDLLYSGSAEPQFAFRIAPNHERSAAVLFLMRRDRALKVTNIVPDVGELTRQQYNTLVEAFDTICKPIAKRHGLRFIKLHPDLTAEFRAVNMEYAVNFLMAEHFLA
jgi:hypothetical protein